jgi:hypothetical protein
MAVSSRHMFIAQSYAQHATVLSLDDDLKAVAALPAPQACGVAVCLSESVAAFGLTKQPVIRFADIRAASPADWRFGAEYRNADPSADMCIVDMVESEGRLYAIDWRHRRSVPPAHGGAPSAL